MMKFKICVGQLVFLVLMSIERIFKTVVAHVGTKVFSACDSNFSGGLLIKFQSVQQVL